MNTKIIFLCAIYILKERYFEEKKIKQDKKSENHEIKSEMVTKGK